MLYVNLIFVVGLVLIPIGVGHFHVGAAIIVAGLELAGGAILWHWGGKR